MEIDLFQDGFFNLIFDNRAQSNLNKYEVFNEISAYPSCRGLFIRNSVTMAYLLGLYHNIKNAGDDVLMEINSRLQDL